MRHHVIVFVFCSVIVAAFRGAYAQDQEIAMDIGKISGSQEFRGRVGPGSEFAQYRFDVGNSECILVKNLSQKISLTSGSLMQGFGQ